MKSLGEKSVWVYCKDTGGLELEIYPESDIRLGTGYYLFVSHGPHSLSHSILLSLTVTSLSIGGLIWLANHFQTQNVFIRQPVVQSAVFRVQLWLLKAQGFKQKDGKSYHENSNNKDEEAILLPGKINFKTKSVIRDKQEQFIMIKWLIHRGNITIINICATNNRAP